MMTYVVRVVGILITAGALSCCATAQKHQLKRFRGHWAGGECYSWFTLLDDTKSYWVFAGDMPAEACELFSHQPQHLSPYSETGDNSANTRDCQAIYLDVFARIEESQSSSIEKHLHVYKILKMEPAEEAFFKPGKHPFP